MSGLFLIMTFMVMPLAHAIEFYDCKDSFYGGTPPDYLKAALTKDSYPLCFDGFATMYSGTTRTGMWSATHLTRKRLAQADTVERTNNFHEESRIPDSKRASLKDYAGSGYDRGHIAPSADMATVDEQYSSFSLANMAPQSPRNNRYIWRMAEAATQALTKQYGEVYVVTGVTFKDKKLKTIGSGVVVPSHFFKAVYIPAIGQAGAYYAPNDESERIEIISIDELALRTNIDVMPAIDPTSKSQVLDLPLRASEVTGEALPDPIEEEPQPWWLVLLAEIIYWIIEQLRQ